MDALSYEVRSLAEKFQTYSRKPVVEVKIQGDEIQPDLVQAQIAKLSELTLRIFWKVISKEENAGSVFMGRPMKIEDEMFKIAKETLGSDTLANFAINELLPLLTKGSSEEANQLINENFKRFKEGLRNAAIS